MSTRALSESLTRRTALAGIGAGGLALASGPGFAQGARPQELKVGIATYLSGPASVFGVPA